jgi:hypothetical protein
MGDSSKYYKLHPEMRKIHQDRWRAKVREAKRVKRIEAILRVVKSWMGPDWLEAINQGFSG